MTKYKYNHPEDLDVIFAVVVEKPRWIDRNNTDTYKIDFPVGAITWITRNSLHTDEDGNPYLKPNCSVHPEKNRYSINFEPSCFELLITSKQKVKK